MHTPHPHLRQTAARVMPFVSMVRAAEWARLPRRRTLLIRLTAAGCSAVPAASWAEIQQHRVVLCRKEQRREDLRMEAEALRLWDDGEAEGRIPRWVAEAGVRRREAELAELDGEIRQLAERIADLFNHLPDIEHGTPSLELDSVADPAPAAETLGSKGGTLLPGPGGGTAGGISPVKKG